MKKIGYIMFCIISILGYSCEIDNYEAPGATLQGKIVNAAGVGLELEQGAGSARVKLDELSWSATPVAQYLNLKQDGSYINTKLFPGQYRVTPVEGPFYPIAAGQEKTIDLTSGAPVTADFTVVPYLNVDWIGEPEVTSDKKISVKFKFVRNAAPTGLTQPAPLDYQLFISTTQYVGNNNFDNTRVGGVVAATVAMEGQERTIVSSAAMKYSTTYYVRVGVRVNDSFKKYNYTTVKIVTVP